MTSLLKVYAIAVLIGLATTPVRAEEMAPVPPAAVPDAQTLAEPPPVVPPPAAPAHPGSPEGLVEKSVKDLSKGDLGAAVRDDVKALRRGPLLIHGNYCGIGNRPRTAPIDALDEACMHHDACTTTGKMPSCACNDRLRVEATAIAKDPRTPPELQALATTMAASMVALICK